MATIIIMALIITAWVLTGTDMADGYWYSTSVDDELSRNYSSYYDGTEYENGYGYTDFEDTDYYSSYLESSSSYNDDWDGDNGGDWDYGGNWDAGDTNWTPTGN